MRLLLDIELVDKEGNILKRPLVRVGTEKLHVQMSWGEASFRLTDGMPSASDWRIKGLRVSSDSLLIVKSRYGRGVRK